VVEQVRLKDEQVRLAQARIEERDKQKTPPPAFVKANVKKPPVDQKKPRKKRAGQHTHGRRREAPTRIVDHPLMSCPPCASRVGGISVARRRQVIEIAPLRRSRSGSRWSPMAGGASAASGAKRRGMSVQRGWGKDGWA
jgi:hypothetical protein